MGEKNLLPTESDIFWRACLPSRTHEFLAASTTRQEVQTFEQDLPSNRHPALWLIYRVASESSPGHGNALQSDTRILHVSRLEPASTQTATTPGIRLMRSSTYWSVACCSQSRSSLLGILLVYGSLLDTCIEKRKEALFSAQNVFKHKHFFVYNWDVTIVRPGNQRR
jgi:hypothetical protein